MTPFQTLVSSAHTAKLALDASNDPWGLGIASRAIRSFMDALEEIVPQEQAKGGSAGGVFKVLFGLVKEFCTASRRISSTLGAPMDNTAYGLAIDAIHQAAFTAQDTINQVNDLTSFTTAGTALVHYGAVLAGTSPSSLQDALVADPSTPGLQSLFARWRAAGITLSCAQAQLEAQAQLQAQAS